MAKNGFKLIDAEMHVMEPVDLCSATSILSSGRARRGGENDASEDRQRMTSALAAVLNV
jgi:hypothetical protein